MRESAGIQLKTGGFALLPGTFLLDDGGKRRSGGAFLLDESKDLLCGGRKGDSRRGEGVSPAGRRTEARRATAESVDRDHRGAESVLAEGGVLVGAAGIVALEVLE